MLVRYLLMPVAAALLLCWRFGLRWPRVPKIDLLALLKLGIAGHLQHVGLVTYGIHWSTAFSSSLILCVTGVEPLTRGQVVGVAVAPYGVVLFLPDKLLGGQRSASAGDLVLLVATSFFTYHTVAAKPLMNAMAAWWL